MSGTQQRTKGIVATFQRIQHFAYDAVKSARPHIESYAISRRLRLFTHQLGGLAL